MIDPKFNELPVDAVGEIKDAPEEPISEGQLAGQTRKPRQGLSINDTIAAGASLSVGSRGVDTSGASSGAGAGAGMTITTPSDDGSPAPNIVPGARGSGTTPRGISGPGTVAPRSESTSAGPTTRLEAGTEDAHSFTPEEISTQAYQCWHERGCPHGSAEQDWDRAVQQLREQKERERRSAASA